MMIKKVFFGSLAAALACGAVAKDVTCVCVYYPHWHRYAKGDEWFSSKWSWSQGEWAFVKDAKPRFAGHKQPLRPYAGFLDESNPADMAKDIALAANAGIGVFLYDYYWYDGKVTQEDALEKGFLGAPNRDRMKFALMWCYHERNDQFRPELGKPRRRLMSLAHTPEEFQGLIAHSVKHYFPRPEYWRLDGKLFFSIYNAPYFTKNHGGDAAKIRAELDAARAQVRAAGLGEVHFNAQNPRSVGQIAFLKECGFDSVTDYNHNTYILPPKEANARRQKGQWEVDYADALPHSRARWTEMAKGALPYFPQVTTGWDSTPRCRPDEPYPWKKDEYPYSMTFRNNTPDLFRRHLADAKAFAEQDPKNPGVVYVNGWNEYTEGTYLVPNNFDSDGFLRAVADVFGRRPADEYTYVNPSTKALCTIPAPDRANVAYGPHPKQKVDLFLPKGRKGPFPVFMYIHGGGWSAGAMEDHILAASIRAILDRGVAVVGTGYRYIQEARGDNPNFPVAGCLDDCEHALKFVKAHAAEWNLDVSRIGLAGGSAGACTSLYLALKDDNALGIAALAPVIPQTSMDPRETREWIPNATYGAHAFGYRNFDEWLAHRDERLADIERLSPAALLRRIDPKKAPRIVLQAGTPPKPGELAKDPTHSPVFCVKFKELADARGIPCDFIAGGKKPCFGDALARVADILVKGE